MSKHLILIICASIIFTACKKTPPPTPNGTPVPPGLFTVTIVDREDTYAIIKWTKPQIATGGNLSYTVKIDSIIRSSNLTDTTYKVINIVDTKSYKGQIIAIDSKGGTTTVNFILSSNSGLVYYNSNEYTFSCYTTSGALVWNRGMGVSSYPAISNDTIFVQGYDPFNGKSYLYALHTNTGAVFWTAPEQLPGGIQGSGVLYYHGMVYSAYPDYIKVYNAKTGAQLWTITPGFYVHTVNDGILLGISTDNNGVKSLVAFDAFTGVKKWSYSNGHVFGLSTEDNGTVYVVDYYSTQNFGADPIADLYALDSKTGSVKWFNTFGGQIGSARSKPLIIGNTIYFYIYPGNRPLNSLFAFNKTTGSLVWQTGSYDGPLIGDTTGVYVNAGTSGLTKFDLKTGNKIWVYNNDIAGDVTLTDNKMYINNPGQYGFYSPLPCLLLSNYSGAVIINSFKNAYNSVTPYTVIINGVTYYSAENSMYRANY
ncbi:hypothetical protein BEL04_05870 [Mucilaginibacter sp. PPCGB 2223]|uniref:PQQ-binding-like beta-propeller repeat protein n=1 Tax=Mucilaginibacter sp. PPCGB 2223 TaxID=1886027 RepID=UPI000826DDA4|nr:PQQ-binding-like beta-propeller repeat protein [Mucilaginibacter sp. PPCGB 2223]OCX53812.1 hypothetical protein BEL04_05870 [Mucilaginibacter sp. PPCGB 2223]